MDFQYIWSFVLEFCVQYWKEILSTLALVITVVFYIIKRRPVFNVMDSIKEDILEILPEIINSVECDGNGQRKKYAVILAVRSYLKKKYSFENYSWLETFVDKAIESILSTPQKKGDSHES